MIIDWQLVATLAAPIIALFAGGWINRWFESRPVLISYFGHVSLEARSVRTSLPAPILQVTAIARAG